MEQTAENMNLLKIIDELQNIVYTSSHDLRGPLVNINGFSGSLMDNCDRLRQLLANENISKGSKKEVFELLEENIPEDLQFIAEGTKKMKSLVDGLLQVSRVGTVKISMENLDLNKIIENIIANVSYKTQETGTLITLQNDLPGCYGDSVQVNQLFFNLIDNAVKYRDPKRKGIIEISGCKDSKNSIYSVKDNGIGIGKEHQDKIFEVYHRLDPDDNVGGEGLGLTIIKRILARHNGTISLQSTPGKGTEFQVTLPGID